MTQLKNLKGPHMPVSYAIPSPDKTQEQRLEDFQKQGYTSVPGFGSVRNMFNTADSFKSSASGTSQFNSAQYPGNLDEEI